MHVDSNQKKKTSVSKLQSKLKEQIVFFSVHDHFVTFDGR